MIEIRNLIKEFKGTTVVKDVSLNIKRGEFVSVVGPSGSGKSQLMYLLAGLETVTSGEVIVENKDITKYNDNELSLYRRDTIGFIFQDFNLDGAKTCLENVTAPMIFKGISTADRNEMGRNALDSVGLLSRANQKTSELSGGQQQRVSIARAIINKPKILLCDEPTGSLDSKSGEDIMNLLFDLNKNGYTIMMVTHNLEQTKYVDRIINIKDGQIIECSNEAHIKEVKDYRIMNEIRQMFNDDELFLEFKTIMSSNSDETKILIENCKETIKNIVNSRGKE